MSEIARQLCDDIVEPALSDHNIQKEWISTTLVAHQYPTRSILIEKEKTVKELDPSKVNRRGYSVTKYKSKDRILDKQYIDKSVNTVITGPLKTTLITSPFKNEGNVTKVRPPDPCKCGMQRGCIKNTKNNPLVSKIRHKDKTTSHDIATSNRATQFMDCINVIDYNNKDAIPPKAKQTQEHTATQTIALARIEAANQVFKCDVHEKHEYSAIAKKIPVIKTNPRVLNDAVPGSMRVPMRWALTRYPMTYGPDF